MRLLSRLLGAAALLVGAAVPLGLTPTPADAATACSPGGVTVVVDPGALGGGLRQGCAGGAGTAAALFGAAGHTLTRVQPLPGAVCSVDHRPAQTCPQMPPANRYWALFWTDGTSSHWTYASLGVDALRVPAGGSVALAWQSAAGNRAPAVAAPVTKAAAPAAKPTRKPSAKPTRKPSPSPSAKPSPRASGAPGSTPPFASTSASASAPPTPTAAAGAPSHRHHRPRASAAYSSTGPTTAPTAGASGAVPGAPSSSPTDSSTGSTSTTTDDAVRATQGGLPGWIAPAVVVVVLAAGGGVVARRRLRG